MTRPKMTGPKMTRPKMTRPKMARPKMTRAKMTRPKMTGPKMTRPKMTGPKMTRLKMTGAKMTGPKMTRTSIEDLCLPVQITQGKSSELRQLIMPSETHIFINSKLPLKIYCLTISYYILTLQLIFQPQ